MTHAQTSKFALFTLLLALFILAACGGAKSPSATNNTPGPVDCTVTGNSFDAACTNNEAAAAGRLELCSGTIADLTAAGGSVAACNAPTLADAICVSSGPNANPFAPICTLNATRALLEVTLTIYEVQETYCTETNFFDHSCTGALVECDDNDVCSDPVNPLRLTACTDYAGDATALMAAGGTVASCDSPLLAGVICGTATSVGTNPFAAICSDATGNSDSANIASRQIAYCSENTEAGTCPMMISTFCATAEGAKSQTLCPSRYAATATAPATVTAVVAKGNARNVADTAEATVLEEIAGGAYTSYVDAIAGTAVDGITRPTFNFGGAAHGVGEVSIIQEGLLLSELVFKESDDDSALTNVEDDEGTELANIGTTDGFAIARVDNPAFSDNPDGAFDTKARFYAGLLTTTDLGAPLTDRSADGIWTAEFVAIVSDSNSKGRTGRSIATRSTLRVSFADKTIQTREVGGRFTPVARTASAGDPKPSNPTDFYDGSRIIIDGRFNVEGVIFGESSWIYDGKTSRGSVSGLIGLEGAVGAFVSNGRNNGVNSNGEYAGGFVASNECAIIPFHASCADRHFDGLRAARIGFCADGTQSTNPLCMQAEVTAITTPCRADPFATPCNTTYAKQYETARNTLLDICRGDNHASVDCTTNARRTVCSFDYYPFAPLCSDNFDNSVQQGYYCQYGNPFDKTNCIDGKEKDEVIDRQRLFCSDRKLVNAQTTPFYTECTRTIQGFCGTGTVLPEPISNLFSNTCRGDNFNLVRGRACLDGYTDSLGMTPTSCGDETTADKDIYAYCDSDAGLTNLRDCPVAYARKNPVVSTVSLADFAGTGENQLLNSDRSGALTIVAEGGASLDDANTNFIVGGVDRLDLGLADDKTVGTRTLRLYELGSNDNVTSGFTLVSGLIDNAGIDVTKHYVGLLSGTNLGAPLSEAPQNSIWDAKIRIRLGKIDTNDPFAATVNADFKLKIDYATRSLKVVTAQGATTTIIFPVSAYEAIGMTGQGLQIHGTQISPVFHITNGKFTDNGVIYGTTNLHARFRNTPGTLTGLIGQDGAVAIFKSDGEHVNDFDYVGGFVAAPPLATRDFRNWEASFDTGEVNQSQTLRNSGFYSNGVISYPYTDSTTMEPASLPIAGFSAEYIKLDINNDIFVNGKILDTTVVRSNETADEDGYENGFAYAFDRVSIAAPIGSGTALIHSFAGLLPTTDVGAPLPLSIHGNRPTNVVWTGRIAGVYNGTEFSDDDFQLNISYGSVGSDGVGAITTPIFGDEYYYSQYGFKYYQFAASPTHLPTPAGNGNSIAVDGTFNSNGVISGGVAFNRGVYSTTLGTLTGLIGHSGAVAVFKGSRGPLSGPFIGIGGSFAGGFVIGPKSCIVAGNCVVFETWENSFGATGANAGNTLHPWNYNAPAGAEGAGFAEYIRLGQGDRISAIPVNVPGQTKVVNKHTTKTLRLNNIHEGGYESGVVFAYDVDSSVSPSIAQIYAAMLPTTNLGSPLTDAAQGGTWTGRLEGYDGAGDSINDTAFALKVTFTGPGGTIASNPTDITLTEGGFDITFDGTFNNIGVIAGTTTGSSGNSATGTFSGLIGEKGAVGVFRGIDASSPTGGYGGGFVVCPYGDADSRCQR
ncbi:MAG: hypothetical protein ACNYPD_05285 [Candidatus Halichondribacter symbioticus]